MKRGVGKVYREAEVFFRRVTDGGDLDGLSSEWGSVWQDGARWCVKLLHSDYIALSYQQQALDT